MRPRDPAEAAKQNIPDQGCIVCFRTVAEIRNNGDNLPYVIVNRGLADAAMVAEPITKLGQFLTGWRLGHEKTVRRYPACGQKLRKAPHRNALFRSPGARAVKPSAQTVMMEKAIQDACIQRPHRDTGQVKPNYEVSADTPVVLDREAAVPVCRETFKKLVQQSESFATFTWMSCSSSLFQKNHKTPHTGQQRPRSTRVVPVLAETGSRACHYHTVDTGCVVWHT